MCVCELLLCSLYNSHCLQIEQIVLGLRFMHNLGVIHGDLKAVRLLSVPRLLLSSSMFRPISWLTSMVTPDFWILA
jgi:serine/threonine protein kinase